MKMYSIYRLRLTILVFCDYSEQPCTSWRFDTKFYAFCTVALMTCAPEGMVLFFETFQKRAAAARQ